jgi:tetrapyrrole methylase family protein / MazG family protein
MLPRVVVVGLGPAGPELVTAEVTALAAGIGARFVRTTRHPAAVALGEAGSFDHVYEQAERLEDVYPRIVEELVAAAAQHGEVLYAVPGSPTVAERTVELLRADARIACDIRPALSFLDLAWDRLGIDPLAEGVRLVDGHRFATEAAGERGPLLVAQCDAVDVLSDVKLALDADAEGSLPAGATVTVLQRLGLPDERVAAVPWEELDRGAVEADHLTSIYLPRLAAPVSAEVARFVELVATLRRECPWDREQTHASLRRHLLEESYEVLEALDAVDAESGEGYEHLEEELGDLLFQVVFHTTLATEAGQFTLADVARGIHDKLRLRHPHVFGDVAVSGADEVVANWEEIKKAEKGRESVFDGVPVALPALVLALKVRKKAATLADAGVAVPALDPVPGLGDGASEEALGSWLLGAVEAARRAGLDPEQALRVAAVRHRDAARAAEAGVARAAEAGGAGAAG